MAGCYIDLFYELHDDHDNDDEQHDDDDDDDDDDDNNYDDDHNTLKPDIGEPATVTRDANESYRN